MSLNTKIIINDDSIFFDFNGCDKQRRAPVNSTKAMTFSACAYVLMALMPSDMPVNIGFYKHVKMNAPLGTVVNAIYPSPVVGGWETQVRVNDLLFRALSLVCQKKFHPQQKP